MSQLETLIRRIVRDELDRMAGAEPLNRPPRTPSDEMMARHQMLAADYLTGLTVQQVGIKHDINPAAVTKALKITGTPARARGLNRQPRRTSERDLKMIEQHKAGMTLEAIGLAHGVTRERARQLLNRVGVDTQHRGAIYVPTPEELAAVEQYKAGGSLDLAAGRLGITVNAFRGLLARNGVAVRPRPRASSVAAAEKAAQVAALYQQGVKAKDIVQRLGLCHVNHVYKYLARAGLPPRKVRNMNGTPRPTEPARMAS